MMSLITSESEIGLHTCNCLGKLEKYCDLWYVDINIDKTKVIVFNKSGKILNYNISFNCHPIEHVQTYKYLLFYFQLLVLFHVPRLDLYKRGTQSIFIQRYISKCKYLFAYI